VEPSAALLISFPGHTDVAARDRLVALLADAGLLAVHEDDVARPSQWTAHFSDRQSRDAAMAAIRNLAAFEDLRLEAVEIEDEDWARRTQADLPAVRIGRVIVAPPWDVPEGADPGSETNGTTVVVIEPSRGFGTGHHQSTRLCLVLLQTRELTNRTMIDVGTGSGVLAIAGAMLGSAYVRAIDVDPDAIENARENIDRNDVAARVEAHTADLSSATLAPADVVTANLTASLLERHAAELTRLLKPGGVLIAAGFTAEEGERVTAAFAPALSLVESAEEEGWQGFVFA
jgi:ribosomal protein L11 methyltransferase